MTDDSSQKSASTKKQVAPELPPSCSKINEEKMSEWHLAVKYRDTGEWKYIGPLGGRFVKEDVSRIGSRRARYKTFWRQYSAVYPRPEHVSPFVECHKIFKAKDKEDAAWQVSTWK